MGGYWTGWKIYSKTRLSDVYGGTYDGPEGWGPARLTLSQSIGVSNSFTGTLKVSKSALDASMGFNIQTTYTKTASYSVSPPDGQKWVITYTRRYDKWKVNQRYYIHMDGVDTYTNTYATVYPKKFDTFSYDYRIIAYR